MLHFIQAPVKQQGDVLKVRLVQLTHLFVLFVSSERIPFIPTMP